MNCPLFGGVVERLALGPSGRLGNRLCPLSLSRVRRKAACNARAANRGEVYVVGGGVPGVEAGVSDAEGVPIMEAKNITGFEDIMRTHMREGINQSQSESAPKP